MAVQDSQGMAHFRDSEFQCKCGRPECDAPKVMSDDFLRRLYHLRTLYGKPIFINSALRCSFQNSKVGGVNDSEHMTGDGADISCQVSRERYSMLKYAIQAGFTRIGIGKTFIHLGTSPTLDKHVVWLY